MSEDADRPGTSTARVALDVAGAALDLCELFSALRDEKAKNEGFELVQLILERGRDLRPYQVEDVLGFLRERLDIERVGSDVPPGDSEGPDES